MRMVKKTIAILGDTGKFSPGLLEILLKQDLRLLFISEEETKNINLKEQLERFHAKAEVEFVSCEREGCWEADIIAITRNKKIPAELVQKIKEVSTQKIVLIISEENDLGVQSELVDQLPFSKVIEINIDTKANKFSVTGNHTNALTGISTIFDKAGYQSKIKKDAGKNMV